MGNIRIFSRGYILKMSFAIVYIYITGGYSSIFPRHTSATHKKIKITIVVEIICRCHRNIYSVIREGRWINSKISFPVICKEMMLDLWAFRRNVIPACAYKQIKVSIAIGIKE